METLLPESHGPFIPPYADPQTEEEFEACHRAYWNFIADHELDDKPEILSDACIAMKCYGCAFTLFSSEHSIIECARCPLKRICASHQVSFYRAPTKESRASTAREIANAWKFTTEI